MKSIQPAASKHKFPVILILLAFLPLIFFAFVQQQDLRSRASDNFTVNSGRPFADNSAWNQVIGSNVVIDQISGPMVTNLSSGKHPADMYAFGTPVFYADGSTPHYTITCTQPWGTCGLQNETVPIPDGAAPAPGSDGHMVIVDFSQRKTYEFWQYNNDKATTGWGGVLPIDGDGRGSPTNSAVGSGVSRLAGVVRTYEMQQGVIDHALVFSTSFCQGPTNSTFYRFPAIKTDGTFVGSGAVPEGARVQLDPTINVDTIAGITQGEKIVAKALQKYGAYNVDCGGAAMAFSFENPIGKTDPYPGVGFTGDYFEMSHIPWNKLRVLSSWNSYFIGGDTQPTTPVGGSQPLLTNVPTTPVPTTITPTYACIGGVPCTSPVPTTAGTPGNGNPGTGTTPGASQAPGTGGSQTPTTAVDPCTTGQNSISSNGGKKHHKYGRRGSSGFLQQFIEFLFKLLELLFRMIGISLPGTPGTNPTPTPTPGTSPTPCPGTSTAPSTAPSVAPSVAPSTEPTPTIFNEPTIGIVPTTAPGDGTGGGTAKEVEITFYGSYDNDPAGSLDISDPVIHQQAGGTGTYADPLTFASPTGTGEYPVGAKIYVPLVQKYFIREDTCAVSWTAPNGCGAVTHVDLYMGNPSDSQAVLACEESLTPGADAQIVLNPPSTLTVDPNPLWNQATGKCMTPH